MLVLLWSLIVVQVADDLAMTKRDIIRKNDQLTRSLEEHVRSSLQAVDVELKLVAAEYRRAGLTPAVKFVMQIANENPLLLQFMILDESGRIVASTLPGAETLNFSDRSYFQVHRNRNVDRLFFSEPLVGKLIDGKSWGEAWDDAGEAFHSNLKKDLVTSVTSSLTSGILDYKLGGMADEALGGPGYSEVQPGVEVKSIREEKIDGYLLRSRRATVPVVTDATAGVLITGTGL